MSDFDDVNVNGTLSVRGLLPARIIGACFVIGDPVQPAYFTNVGFQPTIVRNGVGDYTCTLLQDPGPTVAGGSVYLALDGVPGVVSFVPGPGSVRALLTHLDGTPIDSAGFLLMVISNV